MYTSTLSDATWQFFNGKVFPDHQAAGESQFTEDMSDAVSEADFSKVKHLGGAWILPTKKVKGWVSEVYTVYYKYT